MGGPLDDDALAGDDGGPGAAVHALEIGPETAGLRLDKALTEAAAAAGIDGLSRSRIAEAISAGRVTEGSGATVRDRGRKVKLEESYRIALPAPVAALPEPESIPLEIVFEDPHLVVVNKPAGMVVHPAAGAECGTLVNALLHHCGGSLGGIGGELRPGIVHRLDKQTSGLLVAAKTDAAMTGLATLFAAHDIEREYRAILCGCPDRADPRLAGLPSVGFEPDGWIRIDAPIARHPTDRKRMAVARRGGRRAVTRMRVLESFGADAARPAASLVACRLETGRTHQIRVHAAHIGHPLVGDPVYGRASRRAAASLEEAARSAVECFPRQALHAQQLGFRHPVTGEVLRFKQPPPPDFTELLDTLRRSWQQAP